MMCQTNTKAKLQMSFYVNNTSPVICCCFLLLFFFFLGGGGGTVSLCFGAGLEISCSELKSK